MNKKIVIPFIAVIAILVFLYEKFKDKDTKHLCFNLSTNPDPSVFGKSYWEAFHTLAGDIPCSGCKTFAEKFMVFFHDLVNIKVGHPIYDQKNYDYFLQFFSDLKSGKNISIV